MSNSELNILKQQIRQAKQLLSSLDYPVESIPELINLANVLRQNEHLDKINEAKSLLIEAYELYINELEQKLQKKQRKTTKKLSKSISKKRKRSKR